MAFSSILSASIDGLSVELVHVETDISNGLPIFHMVGFLSSEVKEAAERVRTAIRNIDVLLPAKRIVVNLAPGTVKKRGPSFDLPIALSLLASMGYFDESVLENTLVIGELGLDGTIQGVPGVLPIAKAAKAAGLKTLLLPTKNIIEGALVEGLEVYGVSHLKEALQFLTGELSIDPFSISNPYLYGTFPKENALDFSDIYGQEAVKRAAEIAVSGSHNLLIIGPPGSGKSMIASRLPSILPLPTPKISTEITEIYSVLGMIDPEKPFMAGRPFRSVHHTITKAALIGGGLIPKPGEISLAHEGILFLDELAEFPKSILETLRQPLEEGRIRINRSQGNYTFPANFSLVAAMNPCPCGNYPDFNKCKCTPWQIQQYISKISQPFLDRIDICVEAPRVEYEDLRNQQHEENSATIRARVQKAKKIQELRYQNTSIRSNAMLSSSQIPKYCKMNTEGEKLMKQAYETYNLTARTYHKILKVSRTIADLDNSQEILLPHLKEALSYRTVDKKYWQR